MPPPHLLPSLPAAGLHQGMGEARVQAPELWCSFWGPSPLPGPLCVGCSDVPWSHASPPPTGPPFLQVVPCPEPAAVSQTSGLASTLHPLSRPPVPLPTLPPGLAQPGFPLSTPHLDWGLCPCRHRTDHVASLLSFLHPFPHPTRLHVGQGRDCVILLFQNRALDMASSMKRHPACG